jgi:hypothetical protein
VRTVYVCRGGQVVEKEDAPPSGGVFHVMPDIGEYLSPCGSGLITSRSHRREDLKRNNCRETDPSEFRPRYRNAEFMRRRGISIPQE